MYTYFLCMLMGAGHKCTVYYVAVYLNLNAVVARNIYMCQNSIQTIPHIE